MSQTKRGSLLEACLNTASGFVVSLIVWHFVAAGYGIPMPLVTNLEITGIFTVVSIARSYLWRRLFNRLRT
jgi:membrane protein implicated in regulation of membrane protease activity